MLSEELFKKLEKYEQQLNWALKQNFLRLSPREFGAIEEAHKELTGSHLTKSQQTCNTCRLNATKKVAEAYFEHKKVMEALKKKELKAIDTGTTPTEEIKAETQEEAPKKEEKKESKRGRKPKIDID